MWTVLKIDKKKINLFKEDFKKKLDENFIIYSPKIIIQNFKNNKLVDKEIDLLGSYLFCFHKEFTNPITLNKLKFIRGVKYFLNGFSQSQNEISDFINKCKHSENQKGYISTSFLNLKTNNSYKFVSGPFTNKIFKIINLQKNKIDILMGNIRTTINKKELLVKPI